MAAPVNMLRNHRGSAGSTGWNGSMEGRESINWCRSIADSCRFSNWEHSDKNNRGVDGGTLIFYINRLE